MAAKFASFSRKLDNLTLVVLVFLQAGLCRTLQGTAWWGSNRREEDVGPESFFPRCFDLSDSSQLEDFKENFRHTAAAAVLKVFCRLFAESQSRHASKSSGDKLEKLNVGTADSTHHAPSQKCGSVGGSGVMGGLGYVHVHPWMLGLAVRACRRRLLERSGWKEDHAGQNEGTSSESNGAESLTDREWEALLTYSYDLRRVAVGAANLVHEHEHVSDDERELEKAGEYSRGCSAGVGLRGARGLRGNRAGVIQDGHGKDARRPSSASAEGNCNNAPSQRRQRLSCRPNIALGDGATGKAHRITVPTTLRAVESRDACHDLLGGRGPSAFGRSAGRAGAHDFEGRKAWESGYMARLALEANQLCATFERRCPQWTIDGERNLWVLKPAGASRGQGVRVAWRLDQILFAQKTMGGRVVQKYVEVPLLLPRWSRQPRLSKDSEPSDRSTHHRRNLKRRRGSIHGEETLELERDAQAQRLGGGEEESGAHGSDTSEVVETCWDKSSVTDEEPAKSSRETASPSRRSKGRTRSYAGDEGGVDGDLGTSAGERKFDIRLWVLVTGWDPLEAFVFDEGYLRVCPQNFNLEESKFAEPEVHLTNLSARRAKAKRPTKAWKTRFQRQGGGGGQRRQRSSSAAASCTASGDKDGVREPVDTTKSEVEIGGFVASQAQLIRRLGEMDEAGVSEEKNARGEAEVWARGQRLWRTKVSPSIERVVRRTLLAARPHARPRVASFQLFGFDLLLDRQLRPWLLEVNLSPALSHSSRRQSAMISSMCEGLLRLAVDRIFPAPPPSPPNSDAEGTSFDSDARPTTGAQQGKARRKQPGHVGKWRPIMEENSPCSHNQNPSEIPSPSDAAGGRIGNPSAQVFSLAGRHLTRRGLVRAERGVRQATAATALAVWWRSKADECREARSRKLWAIARIGAWVTKSVAWRRRKAMARSSRSERSARAIQARWRRTAEIRRLAARTAACVVVQTAWRQRQRERRCASGRVRWKVRTGLQRWARLILSCRLDMARKTILRAVVGAMTRHASKRHAAGVIARGLETAGNRRRRSRLRLQRFARTPCLLRVRLAALSLVRVDRARNAAANIIARAFRRATARSAIVRAAFAARILQSWHRTSLGRREERWHASVVVVQQAWRQRRTRRLLAEEEAERPPPRSAAETVATEPSAATNLSVGPGELVAADGAAVLDPRGPNNNNNNNVGQLSPCGKANNNNSSSSGPLAGRAYDYHSSTVNDRPVEEINTQVFLRDPVSGESELLRVSSSEESGTLSSAVCDQSVSPATTAREVWSDPDLRLTDGGTQSCLGHVSDAGDGGSLSYNEARCATMVTAPRPSPTSGTRSLPRTAGAERKKAMAADDSPRGILDLEDILPDILRRHQRGKPSEGKQRGSSEGSRHETKQSKGVRDRPIAEDSRGSDHGRTPPAFHRRDERLPYPPAGGMHLFNTGAQQFITRRSARTRGGEGRRGVTMKPDPHIPNGMFHCGSRTRNSSAGWHGISAKQLSPGLASAKRNRLRVGPSRARAGAKKSPAKIGAGVRGARDSLDGSVRWEAGSGGVLGMLAAMDA